MRSRPHILLVVPRGEAVRNFLHSDVPRVLAAEADVSLLSVVTDEALLAPALPYLTRVIPLEDHPTSRGIGYLRLLTDTAHDRWLWSEVARNRWELGDRRAREQGKRVKRLLVTTAARGLAHPWCLERLTRLEQRLNLRTAGKHGAMMEELLGRLSPDLVFNSSHIHGPAGELPCRVARRMGIRTAGFIFSWDNLTSRSRIFVEYDDYLVWGPRMAEQLLRIYRGLSPAQVHQTGSPQFDFHFQERFRLSRAEVCRRIGIDAERPYVLYTTGIWRHFPEEHRHVEAVARILGELDLPRRPQLVVRTYAKGTSDEMKALAAAGLPETAFRPGLWEAAWHTPRPEDVPLYSSLLHHASVSINAASTVTLEALMLGKPVINLDFDPPGVDLHPSSGYSRHVRFDHFRPIAESGATFLARSTDDMRRMLREALTRAGPRDAAATSAVLGPIFGDTLDGRSGERVARRLLEVARSARSLPDSRRSEP